MKYKVFQLFKKVYSLQKVSLSSQNESFLKIICLTTSLLFTNLSYLTYLKQS